MTATEKQWKRVLWDSFSIQEWMPERIADKAVEDYLTAALLKVGPESVGDPRALVKMALAAVLKAGTDSELDSEMLPASLRDSFNRELVADRAPAKGIAAALNLEADKWQGGPFPHHGLPPEVLEGFINDQLIARLRGRLLWRPFPPAAARDQSPTTTAEKEKA